MKTHRMAARFERSSAQARLRRVGVALSASALVVALAGCGSTALQSVGTSGVAVDANGVPIDASGVPLDANGMPLDPSLVAPGSAGPGGLVTGSDGLGGTSAPGAASGAPGSTTGPGATTPVASGDPVTGPIKIGVVATDLGAIGAVFGAGNDDFDIFASSKKLIAYLNKNGGAGGREIQPVYYAADSGSDANTNGQRACQAFTQDDKVELVISVGFFGEVLPACLKAAGIAYFDSANWFADATVAQQFPNWLAPSAARLDRNAVAQVEQAAARGILKKGDKLGVLVESCPWGARTLASSVKPTADKLGIPIVTGSIKCITNIVADLTPVSNDVQRETLRFASEGVTDVVILSFAEAFVLANFTDNASQQNYKPQYLATSNAYLHQNGSDGTGAISISRDALPNIFGFGTLPLLDVGPAAVKVGGAVGERRARCTTADPSLNSSQGNPFAINVFYSQCEAFLTMAESLDITQGRTSYPEVANAFRQLLAKGVASANLSGGRYAGSSPERTDGAGFVQPLIWSASKKVFTYDGPVGKLP